MEHKKKRRAVEALKDVLIVVLVLVTVFLSFQSQTVGVSPDSGTWLGALLRFVRGGPAPLLGPPEPDESRRVPVYPVRVLISNSSLMRYGAQYDADAVDACYSEVFSVLGEALSTAAAPKPVSESVWRQALTGRPGVYYDFLGAYPLETLLSWLDQGASNAALTAGARRLLLAEDGAGGAVLYYHNASDGSYYACRTSGAVPAHLLAAVDSRGGVGYSYAFELDSPAYRSLDPYVLIGAEPPDGVVFQASDPLGRPGDQDALQALLSSMKVLGFQTQSGVPYQTGSGEWVLNDGPDQLRVSASGEVSFHTDAADAPRFPVLRAGDAPTATELLNAVQPIAAGTVGAKCGDARLYLIGLERLDSGLWQADFGYSLQGAAVQLYGEPWAARFLLSDGAVVSFTLRFRSYAATAQRADLLPELQAAAALVPLDRRGGELLLRYEDTGGDAVRPCWTVG